MLRSNTTATLVALIAPIALAALACGGPPPAKMTPVTPRGGVAANSASEQRLAMNKPAPAATTADDPTQPLTTPLNAEPATAPAATPAATGKGGKPPKGGPVAKETKDTKAGGAKVSKAECKQLFDKYIDLTVSSDPRFADIPPEMVAQLKQSALSQAQSEKGDPCSTQDISRAQYNCAIAAPTTAAWQRCMPK